jgi:serine/threonine protein kinase
MSAIASTFNRMSAAFGSAGSAAAPSAPPLVDHITVKGVAYAKIGALGEGSYSTVYSCRAPDGTDVAIKRCAIMTEEAAKAFRREFGFMTKAAHRNIVRCIAYDISTSDSGKRRGDAVLELCPSSVVKRMQQLEAEKKRFNDRQVATIIAAVAQALNHMHTQTPPIAHRDIKAENILVSSDGLVKLADFGSATDEAYECTNAPQVAIAEADINRCTTMAYRAPEMADLWQRKRVDERVDAWALGVLAYYLCYFQLPFEETKLAIINTPLSIPASPQVHPAIQTVIRGCLTKDADRRITVADVLDTLHRAFPECVAAPPTERPPSVGRQPLAAGLAAFARQSSSDSASPAGVEPSARGAQVSPPQAGGGALFNMLQWAGSVPAQPVGGSSVPASPLVNNAGLNASMPRTPLQAESGSRHSAELSNVPSSAFEPPTRSNPEPALFNPPAAQSSNASPGVDLFSNWGAPPAGGGAAATTAPPVDLFAAFTTPATPGSISAAPAVSARTQFDFQMSTSGVGSALSTSQQQVAQTQMQYQQQALSHSRTRSMEEIFGGN